MSRTTAHDLALAQAISAARRYGGRSIMLAGVGLLMVSGLSILTTTMPGSVTAKSGVAGALFVVPLLHALGILFGLIGLIGSPSMLRPTIGLTFNLVLIGAGSQITSAIAGSFGA